jgi:hypothetical protein
LTVVAGLAGILLNFAPASAEDNTEARVKALEAQVAQLKSAEERVQALENRVAQLESSIEHKSSIGAVLFLYGVFCALWAQNTGRSAWLWFFLGLIFSVITVIVLLVKNSNDREGLRSRTGESATKTGSQAV